MTGLRSRPNRRPYLLACIGTDWEANLPEHFIRHYLDLGIRPQNLVIALHSDKRDFLEATLKIFRGYGIEPRRIWRGPFNPVRMGTLKKEMQREFIPRGDWVVHADLDEFHEYPAPLTEYLEDRERSGENVVVSCFIDGDRTYKLRFGSTSESGRYVKPPPAPETVQWPSWPRDEKLLLALT